MILDDHVFNTSRDLERSVISIMKELKKTRPDVYDLTLSPSVLVNGVSIDRYVSAQTLYTY